jgi:hypothetical protein
VLTRRFEFRAGFLHACIIRTVTAKQFDVAAEAPLWATVQRLDATYARRLPTTLKDVRWLGVRNLGTLTAKAVALLPPTLEEVDSLGAVTGEDVAAAERLIREVPALRRIVSREFAPSFLGVLGKRVECVVRHRTVDDTGTDLSALGSERATAAS